VGDAVFPPRTIAGRGGKTVIGDRTTDKPGITGTGCRLAGICLLAMLLAIPPARGQDLGQPPAAEPPPTEPDLSLSMSPDEPTVAEVAKLIAQLDAPKPADRAQAALRLIEIGPPAFQQLREAYLSTHDLEPRMRIEEIVREAYLSYHVFSRNAFLGIQHHPTPALESEDPRIPPGHVGIRVNKVLSDTAAEAAGIQPEDIIVAFDDEPLPAGGNPVQAFVDRIRTRGPGAEVRLAILRKAELVELEVTLRPRPRSYYWRQGTVTQMLLDREQRFLTWWDENFRKGAGAKPSAAARD
jgi:hypothetical protein